MRLNYETDDGAGARARLGLIVLHVDETIEGEFRRLLADMAEVALYCTRVESGAEVTGDTLAAMAARLPGAARLLPPSGHLDVIGYACTSGAAVIGAGEVARLVRSASPERLGDTPVTDPLSAVKAACRALGVRRLGFVTPYVPSVTATLRQSLEADGLSITATGSFEQAEERIVARISPRSIHDAIVHTGSTSPCDAVFVSCTNARTLDVIETAERALGIPVVSSNLALAWHMLRLAGIDDRRSGFGTLLQR